MTAWGRTPQPGSRYASPGRPTSGRFVHSSSRWPAPGCWSARTPSPTTRACSSSWWSTADRTARLAGVRARCTCSGTTWPRSARSPSVTPTAAAESVAALLAALVERARELGVNRLFCLTFEVPFFLRHGFRVIEGTPVTPDVYAELLRSYDEGVAEFLDLDRVKPNTLGNTRMLLELEPSCRREGDGARARGVAGLRKSWGAVRRPRTVVAVTLLLVALAASAPTAGAVRRVGCGYVLVSRRRARARRAAAGRRACRPPRPLPPRPPPATPVPSVHCDVTCRRPPRHVRPGRAVVRRPRTPCT